jgi:ABC-type transport system substrate-binding protein
MRALGLVSRALLLTSLLVGVLAPALARAEPAERAYVGVYLHDVTHFDQRNGTFAVDADVWLKWHGELDPSRLRVQNASVELETIDLGETNDGDWHSHRYHLRGTLRGEFPLHRFPFDVQTLGIQFELPGVDTELVPDLAGSGIASTFSVTGWHYEPKFQPRVRHMVYASDLGTIEQEGRSTKISRVGFEVTLERPTITIAVKLFLPLVLLLLIALIALYLAPDLVDARTGIGVTVLLACFAFQFTVAGTIPDVSYLTVVDELFILAYALSTLTLIVTVAAYWLHRTDRLPVAMKVDRFSRVAIPLVAILATAGMLNTAPPSEASAAVNTEDQPARATSARDVLRIGTLQLNSASFGLLGATQRAGLTRLTEDGETVGQLAEHAPTVASENMEFHANGRLKIHWTLRPDLRWSDGHALTSDDFRFALEVSPDPDLVSIETPDPRTLILTYDDALAYALEGFQPLPRHALESALSEDGGYDAIRDARRTQVMPSAGPYRLVEFVVNESAVLEANQHYVGRAPSIARIEVRVFETAEALAAAFESNAIDLVVPGALTPEAAADLATRRAEAVIVRPAEDLYALVPDASSPLLARRVVRRAIWQAIDRDALATAVFGPLGAPAETPSRGLAAAPEDHRGYDPVAARAALEAADALGATIPLTHMARPLDLHIATMVRDALVAVGLVVELREVVPGTPAARNREHGGLMLSMIRGGDDDSDPRRYWNLPRVNGRIDASARTFAFDEATAQIVDRWSRALYAERRAQLGRGIDMAVAHRLPLLPLAFGTERLAVLPTLRGWDAGRRFGDTAADWHFVE